MDTDNATLLSDLSADLLTYEKYELFLERLFAQPSGQVVALLPLLEGLPHRTTFADFGVELYVHWADWQAGFCLVCFYCPQTLWSNTALYNRALLLRKMTLRKENPHA